MKSAKILALSAALSIATITASGAAFSADGKALYDGKACASCHGAEGKKPSVSTYPKLAGQNKDYTLAQLKYFKDGSRSSGQSVVMKGMVAGLSDEEMEAIADYLSNVE